MISKKMMPIGRNVLVLALTLLVLFGGFSSAQATYPSPASEFLFLFQFDLFQLASLNL